MVVVRNLPALKPKAAWTDRLTFVGARGKVVNDAFEHDAVLILRVRVRSRAEARRNLEQEAHGGLLLQVTEYDRDLRAVPRFVAWVERLILHLGRWRAADIGCDRGRRLGEERGSYASRCCHERCESLIDSDPDFLSHGPSTPTARAGFGRNCVFTASELAAQVVSNPRHAPPKAVPDLDGRVTINPRRC
jgi:hypothetical protein